jgi:glyoxylase-like metal-dependent hydrolase (beta-lactamase superfamily II)
MNMRVSRRKALTAIGLAASASVLGVPRRTIAKNSSLSRGPANAEVYQISIGDFLLTVLSDGYGKFPATQPSWAPEAKPEDLKHALEEDFLPTDELTLSFNPILIENGKDLLLCDTGCGKLFEPTTGRLLQQLDRAGYRRDQITSVFLSHAHFDHLGGLLSEDGKPVFSSAQHFVHDREWDFWTGDKPDLSKQPLDNQTKSDWIHLAKKTFGTMESNFKRIAAGTSLIDGVTIEAAPGHTPGHSLLRIQSGDQRIVHIFDLAHHPVIMFKNPSWTVAADTDPAQAAATRKQLFNEFAESRTRILGYHLPFPGIGHVARDGNGFRWVPEAWVQI